MSSALSVFSDDGWEAEISSSVSDSPGLTDSTDLSFFCIMSLRCCASSSECLASSIFFPAFCSRFPNVSYCDFTAESSLRTSVAFSFMAAILKPIASELRSAVTVVGPAIIMPKEF